MSNLIKFICFIAFTILIFFINNVIMLVLIFLCTLVLAKILKVPLKSIFINYKIFLPVILITCFINMWLGSIYDGILIGLRMIICYSITYIYYSINSALEIANTIEKLFLPLTYFNVNTSNIGIMVAIAICTIPTLKIDICMKIKAMELKGKTLNINTILIIIKPILISALRKTNEMEKNLIAKAYDE